MITSGSRRMSRSWVNKAAGRAGRGQAERAGVRLHRPGCLGRAVAYDRYRGNVFRRATQQPDPRLRLARRRRRPGGERSPGNRRPRFRLGGGTWVCGQRPFPPGSAPFPGGPGGGAPGTSTGAPGFSGQGPGGPGYGGPEAADPGRARAGRGNPTPQQGTPAVPAAAARPLPLAARRRDSSTVSTRLASTRSSSRRATAGPGPRVFPGDPGHVPGPYGDGFAGKGPGGFPGPGPGTAFARDPGDPSRPGFAGGDRRREAARLPATWPVLRPDGTGARLSPGARPRVAHSPLASSRPRPGRRRPATTRRARPRPGRRSRASSSRLASSPQGQTFYGTPSVAQFAPGWAGPGRHWAREHRDQAASQEPGQGGPCPLTARRATHG